jgi:hypothetical protein
MFIQSRPVRDIIIQQICGRVHLIRSEQVLNDPTQKNTSIQYTHDVVSFKEKHLLRVSHRISSPTSLILKLIS